MEPKVQKESLSFPVRRTVTGTPAKPKDRCLWQKVGREKNEFLGSVMCKFIGQESGASSSFSQCLL